MKDDLISQQAVLKQKFTAFYANGAEIKPVEAVAARDIEKLPTVPGKSGWWLIRSFGSDAKCSECGMYFTDVYDMENSDNYCRHCGTKMNGLKLEDEADV